MLETRNPMEIPESSGVNIFSTCLGSRSTLRVVSLQYSGASLTVTCGVLQHERGSTVGFERYMV